ncbi:XamI family restriction endonuclease [Methylopila sp. Yamaguchi]|uniref:XamI family restriction endonuclease n=1 Tax=Methylopila sp. Yamaguchi TaxID=1437817 RepID=UPI000CB7E133|nr:XamI family restriction endonuclease [Methylopila sp. Yamaguchi]GBD47071.1 type II restriction enzyme XamI [Methylopila sp. Yamaguchi]
MANPLRWSDEELKTDRDLAELRFIAERQNEGPAAYHGTWDIVEPQIRAALSATEDLTKIEGQDLLSRKGLWQILRYMCAPRISEEDLWTLVGKKFKNVPKNYAEKSAQVISDLVDLKRFPWVLAGRIPSTEERDAAVMATATLLAHERLGTSRRGGASKKQEDAVSEALVLAELTIDASRRPLAALDGLARAHFSRERKVGSAKCDIPIRLKDGRLLALECKVSNGPKNSWKRLQREVGGKAETWRNAYGSQVVTGALLAGVYDLKCLSDAQNNQNVALFWQHDLKPLIQFVLD